MMEEWTAKQIFRCPPTVETDRLLFRAMNRKDAADMFEYASDTRTTEFLLWSPHPDFEYTTRYLTYIEGQYRAGNFFDWAVILKETGKMIGTGGFTTVDEKNRSGEIGYVLNPSFWHRGYGTEIAKELLSFGFSVLGMERIQARYILGNRASLHVMEKCGMRFEGVFRHLLYVKGMFRDIGVCSILREEFFSANKKRVYRLALPHWYDRFH